MGLNGGINIPLKRKEPDWQQVYKSIIYHGWYFKLISTHDIAQYKGMKKKCNIKIGIASSKS